jgi:hypothetical protein
LARFLARRLALTIPVLLGVATLVFSLIHFIPGDPAQAMLGESAPQADVDELRRRLGLDRPLLEQYGVSGVTAVTSARLAAAEAQWERPFVEVALPAPAAAGPAPRVSWASRGKGRSS